MFTAYELTEQSRNMLLATFKPKYERVICHHITVQYGVPKDTPAPEMPESVVVVGYIDSGDGVQGLLVAVNGSVTRSDGQKFHITLSIDSNRKPAETNKYTDHAVSIRQPIKIEVEPKNLW